jgi:hypothetical protein
MADPNAACKSIIEVVTNDQNLGAILRRMIELDFLVPGVIDPLAYMRNTDRIESEWMTSKTKDCALAMGIHLHHEFFYEGMNALRQKRGFKASDETRDRLENWKPEVTKLFKLKAEKTISDCKIIGQYLEFRTRQAHGY